MVRLLPNFSIATVPRRQPKDLITIRCDCSSSSVRLISRYIIPTNQPTNTYPLPAVFFILQNPNFAINIWSRAFTEKKFRIQPMSEAKSILLKDGTKLIYASEGMIGEGLNSGGGNLVVSRTDGHSDLEAGIYEGPNHPQKTSKLKYQKINVLRSRRPILG